MFDTVRYDVQSIRNMIQRFVIITYLLLTKYVLVGTKVIYDYTCMIWLKSSLVDFLAIIWEVFSIYTYAPCGEILACWFLGYDLGGIFNLHI